MAISPILFGFLSVFLTIAIVVSIFWAGIIQYRKKEYSIAKILNWSGGIFLFFMFIVWYIALDDRYYGDLWPTLYVVEKNGDVSTKKIITPTYQGKKIKFKSSSYYIQNLSSDTLLQVKAFFHFYGEHAEAEDKPTIINVIEPNTIVESDEKPSGLVDNIPMRRSFKVSRVSSSRGRGRTATYLIPKRKDSIIY